MTFFGDLLARAGGSLDTAEPLVRPAAAFDAGGGDLIEIEERQAAPPISAQPPAPPRIEIERSIRTELPRREPSPPAPPVAPVAKRERSPIISTTEIVYVPPPPSPPPVIERRTSEIVKTERVENIEVHHVREVHREQTERIARVVEIEPPEIERAREVVVVPAEQPKPAVATLEPRAMLATPPPAQEQQRPAARATEAAPEVTITIGRVIVRAERPETSAPARKAPAGPAMTLADYLARRDKE